MKRGKIKEQFEISIPPDEPVFPLNVVCQLLHFHYWTLHELLKEGVIQPTGKAKRKKLFSYKDVKRLKYVQYLMQDKGVNVKGVKVILEMENEE
ncbi:MAG: chaperone modulator CbpM [Candidatus Omnitrophota bacterium]|nr:MerR family transcriptional regulator [Candidatus Omnitrophota bacterium]